MPSIAEMLVSSGLQQARESVTKDPGSGLAVGAQLANHMQEMKMQQAQLQQKKQEAQQAKFAKVGDWFDTAAKMPDGPAKKAFVSDFIPKGISALGLQDQFDPTVQKMLQGDSNLASYLSDQIRKGKMDYSALQNPDQIAAIAQNAKQFGDLQTFKDTVSNYSAPLEEASKEKVNNDIKAQNAVVLAGPRQEQADTSKGNQSAVAVARVNNDEAIKNMTQQSRNIQKGMENLASKPSVTQLNEVAQDFSAAMSGKAASSDFKLKEISSKTMGTELAKIKTFVSNNPDQPAPQEMVDFWRKFGDRLDGAYHRQIGARAQTLGQEASTVYSKNPDAVEAVKGIVKSYKNGSWSGAAPSFDIGGVRMNADQAKTFYKQHPQFQPDPDTKSDLGL